MKKYELKNLPEGGIKFERSEGRSIILDENTSDEDCDILLDNGNNENAAYYIHTKKDSKAEKSADLKV